MTPSRCALIAVVFVAGSPLSRGASADPVLSVEQVSGEVQVDHLGETHLLQVGDELHDRDVVRVDDDAYLALRFSQHGALELGSGTALAIERLPADADTADLRSIFSLWKGYLHVLWQRPSTAPWPLYVYFGGQRSSLVDGEYFFERDGTRSRSCVAAGRLTATPISGAGVETLRPSACYEMAASGGQPKVQARTIDSWISVRRAFALDPDPRRALPAFAAHATEEAPAESPTAPAPLPAATVPASANPLPSSPATAPLPPPSAPAKPIAPAPPAAAAPAPDAAAATPPGEPNWTILIGSYADPQNAAQVQQKLIAVGFTPLLRVKVVDGRAWNSVQIRGIATREAAEAAMANIVAKLGLPNLRIVDLQ